MESSVGAGGAWGSVFGMKGTLSDVGDGGLLGRLIWGEDAILLGTWILPVVEATACCGIGGGRI